jgi:type I restriction enzyme, S subunit
MSSEAKTSATKDDGKPALVPKLRFPEFQAGPPWQQSELGKEASILKGKGIAKADVHPDGAQPCIRYGELYTHYDEIINSVISTTKISADELFLSKVNDVIIPSSGETKIDIATASCVLLDNIALGGDLNVIRSKLSGPFLSYYLNGPKRFDIAQVAQGDTVVHLYPYQIEELEIAFPSPAEQKKIAECLSSVDEVIAAQARKVGAFKIHKKGLMQQLFPREGETQPHLRFPKFLNAEEWIQKTVGDVSEVLMCKRVFAEETNPSEGVPFYKIGTLGGIPDAFISKEQFADYKSRYNFPRKSEVLITCSGTVGKCLPYDGKDAYFQDSNIVWLDNPTGEVSNEFLLMLLSNVNWGRLNSTTITRIYGPDLRGVSINFPEDKAEQKRITDCLTTLDDLIAAQIQKLEALNTHKQGLMQQLFPSPEEVQA